jgi:hypothetical protein
MTDSPKNQAKRGSESDAAEYTIARRQNEIRVQENQDSSGIG